MADTTTKVAMANLQQVVRNAEFKDIYSNFVRLSVSGSDLSIVFSKIIESSVGINVIEDQAIVRMAPHQFKTLLDQANKTFTAWEEVFGQVKESMKTPSQDIISEGVKRLKEALDKAQI